MTIDSISDMATIIRNAITIKNSLVTLPYTKNNEIIAKILAKEGFIHCVTTTNKTNQSSSHSFSMSRTLQGSALSASSMAKPGGEPQKDQKDNFINNNNLPIETSTSETFNTNLKTNQRHSISNNDSPLSTSSKGKPGSESQKKTSLSSAFIATELNLKVIILALKYVGREKKPMIHAIKRISKPSLKWYSKSPIPQSLGGLGIFIVSTSSGIVTDKEARDKKLGGEILLEIW